MNYRHAISRGMVTVLVATAFLLADIHGAFAQNTRYWNRSVKAGQQIEFQWLNYDESTCKDRGYPSVRIDKAPKLGKFRTVKRKFTQREGRCQGSKFSVLLLYYVAGRKKGTDRPAFTVQGRDNIIISLKIDVT